MNYKYIRDWVSPDAFLYLLTLVQIFASHRSTGSAKPKHLDSVLVTPLDYAMARLWNGQLALVPHNTVAEDEVALLSGSPCPFVARRVSESQWWLVGDCYVDEMMKGELWAKEVAGNMDFV